MFVISLLAALAGTPLRQAEAAHDLACSLAELGDGDLVEVVDGGVGDDPGETIRGDDAPAPVAPAAAAPLPSPLPPQSPSPVSTRASARLAPTPWPDASAPARCP